MNRAIILRSTAIGLCLVVGAMAHNRPAPPFHATAATLPQSNDALLVVQKERQRDSGALIEGTITYERDRKRSWRYQRYYVKGRSKGPLAEAVVALSPLDRNPVFSKNRFSKPRTHSVDQKDFRFTPETIAIRAGDRVKFSNSDGALHNVFSPSKIHRFDVNLRKGNESIQTFDRAGGTAEPARLRCAFHASMQAWIYVFDHPHYQVTKVDGRFQLKNVPPGRYELVMAHPAGELKVVKQLTVTAGKTIRLDVRVSPDNKVESKPK
ncbi:MAG: hypothetical protein HON53_23625 [Planctomycetaceae bacterium]|jgi:plastocyanin|nr:hypothetical protein [Planctomycetaceae bacterium]MBT6157166.1 hypothetical protein [Planctomycetaceae bacterium]MBT6483608.1 hypothetical protein [Planctomycetaceae bacterium]MBT6494032.1 hypothetical protein [Planctomycetaceae bacterium]